MRTPWVPRLISARWLNRAGPWFLGSARRLMNIGLDLESSASSPLDSYVRTIFQALALFRFVSFSMGVFLIFAVDSGYQRTSHMGVAVLLVGLYAALRVAWRFDPVGYSTPVRAAILVVDASIGLTLVIVTGALDSAFLIYSLSPILTASLLMDIRTAVAIASVSALSVAGVHIAAGLGVGDSPRILTGNYLAFALLYSAVSLLIAYLPFLVNLNWQRRVRSESQGSERRRLRREVHDSVAQTLAFLSLKMRRAEERASQTTTTLTAADVADIGRSVERAYLSVRDFMDSPEVSENAASLESSLSAAVSQWRRDVEMDASMESTGEEGEISAGAKLQLVQIAREALANVAKHAISSHVWVRLDFTAGLVTLSVRDDGRGFSTDGPRGHGMQIMRERAAMIDAALDILSTPGEGTEVIVTYRRNGLS